MSDTALVRTTVVPSNEVALIPKPARVRLKGLPASAFQHPLDRPNTSAQQTGRRCRCIEIMPICEPLIQLPSVFWMTIEENSFES